MRRPLLEPSDSHGVVWSLVLDDAAAPQPERLRLARMIDAARRGDANDADTATDRVNDRVNDRATGQSEMRRRSAWAVESWPMDGTRGVARALSVLYGPDSPLHTERA